MTKAYLLINTESGSEDEVLDDLKKIEGVDGAYVSYGVYDIIAKVEAESMPKLREMVTSRIRGVSKIRSTLTLIIVEE
jgi:DNA-binding Lrp family transcriptional regulator